MFTITFLPLSGWNPSSLGSCSNWLAVADLHFHGQILRPGNPLGFILVSVSLRQVEHRSRMGRVTRAPLNRWPGQIQFFA